MMKASPCRSYVLGGGSCFVAPARLTASTNASRLAAVFMVRLRRKRARKVHRVEGPLPPWLICNLDSIQYQQVKAVLPRRFIRSQTPEAWSNRGLQETVGSRMWSQTVTNNAENFLGD